MPYLLDFDGSFCLLPSPSYHLVTQGFRLLDIVYSVTDKMEHVHCMSAQVALQIRPGCLLQTG